MISTLESGRSITGSRLAAQMCVACGNDITLFGPRGAYRYFRCASCSTLQLYPMPDSEFLEKLYAEKFADGPQSKEFADPELWNRVAYNYHKSILNLLEAHVKPGLVIDLGAGWGGLISLMQKLGYECIGLEKSTAEAAYAQGRGLPVLEGDLGLVGEQAGKVAAITLCAVFEHLTDHGEWLTKMNRLLMPGGCIITLHPTSRLFSIIPTLLRLGNVNKEIPDFDGTFAAPWHTVLFSVKGTQQLVAKYGFDCIEVRPALQGRKPGLLGLAQGCLEMINRLGWALCGVNWPLVTTHVFVLKKSRSI